MHINVELQAGNKNFIFYVYLKMYSIID